MALAATERIDPASPNLIDPSCARYCVIFVLGGPGAGKGTQCQMLSQEFRLQHLSVGDVLRAERDTPGSEYGELIAHNMQEGKIGPMEVTVKLLHNAMKDAMLRDSIEVFLIDGRLHALRTTEWNVRAVRRWNATNTKYVPGFPRKIDQLQLFEATVSRARLALFLDSSEATRHLRLLKRGQMGNRNDDTSAIINKRFDTFANTCMPVVSILASENRVQIVDADKDEAEVYLDVKEVLNVILGQHLRKR
ncbi:MAG: hypothetical protein Q9163_003778 [Psora crenata]